jgi:catechol 2,3-dioxygenase-like lactoylglutathione lyase family enzyme
MGQQFVGIHHVGLRVANLAQAMGFYASSACFKPWQAAQALQWPGTHTLLCNANAGLALSPADPALVPTRVDVNQAGITHVCLQTPGIQTVRADMARAGSSFHCPPIDLGTGFLYYYARDPEFNVLEVEGVAPVWHEPTPWLAHVNLATPDLERALGFYSALLGQPAVRSPRLSNDSRLDAIANLSGAELRIAWLPAGNLQIELMQYFAPATTSNSPRYSPGACGYAHIAFEVTDLHTATEHFVACGGRLQPPTGTDWLTQGIDPDGNTLWLMDLSHPRRQQASIARLPEPFINQRFNTSRDALLKTA